MRIAITPKQQPLAIISMIARNGSTAGEAACVGRGTLTKARRKRWRSGAQSNIEVATIPEPIARESLRPSRVRVVVAVARCPVRCRSPDRRRIR